MQFYYKNILKIFLSSGNQNEITAHLCLLFFPLLFYSTQGVSILFQITANKAACLSLYLSPSLILSPTSC